MATIRFDFPDTASFPDKPAPINDDDCAESDLRDCVEKFLALSGIYPRLKPIVDEQFARIEQARVAYQSLGREPIGVSWFKQDTSNLRRFFAKDVCDLMTRPPKTGITEVDRATTRTDDEALDAVNAFLKPLDVAGWRAKSVTVHVSLPGDRHHYQQFRDCETTTKLLNLHVDPKPGRLKAIVYLSEEVGVDDGPFQANLGSDKWECDELQRIYAWGNSIGNYCHTQLHRHVAYAFPSRFRRNAIVGRLIPDDTPLSEFLLSRLTTFTSDFANTIVFDPCFTLHRGGQCQPRGTRVNLQIVLG